MSIDVHADFRPWLRDIIRICGMLNVTRVTILPTEYTSHADVGRNTVCISFAECAEYSMHPVRALAHELRHIQQWQTGRLGMTIEGITQWDLKYYIEDNFASHYAAPWERDANEFESNYMDEYGSRYESTETRELHRKIYLGAA
jgi:hypothetical protein